MRKEEAMKLVKATCVLFLGLVATASPVFAQGNSRPLDTAGIAKAIGKQGDLSGEMYRVNFPRSDLTVKIGGVTVKPALALTSWAAFLRAGDGAITYGDLALLGDEVNPVISKLEEKGIRLAALHNHLLHEDPPIWFIHFAGYGDEVVMAAALKEALELTKTPPAAAPSAAPEAKPELAGEIERIIGYQGVMGGGVFHIVVPRTEIRVAAIGAHLPGSMGMNTPLNFQLDGKNAAINGDFMLLPGELDPVIKALRANGIEITSLHNHLFDNEPTILFMHFWANDDAVKLARGIRAALDKVNVAKS
jgi:uncharacterized protein DUF1259